MRLTVDNRYVTVDAAQEERAWLDSFLSFTAEGYVRAGGRNKHVTQDIHLFNARRNRFPSGLLASVLRRAPEEGVLVDLDDQRIAPCAPVADADLSWLRDYQQEAVMRAAQSARGILWLATGAGKTEIASALAKLLPVRWLFVVHRANLAQQAAERFTRRTGEVAGMMDADSFAVERFTAATFQTIHAALAGKHRSLSRADMLRLLERFDGVIVDEAHTLPANTYYETLMSIPNAYWRIGLSGTPLARSDRRSIFTIASLGPVLMRVQAADLIEQGHLSRPIIKMVTCEQAVYRPTWQGTYSEGVVGSTKRNRLVAEMARRAHKPSMLFVKQLSHGKWLKRALERMNLRCTFVEGSAPVEQRLAAVRRLEQRDLDVIVTTAVFQEGVDVPELRSVVLADAGKSVIALLQKIGRGMRRTDVKSTFEVWDVFDLAGAGGKKWLETQARTRVRTYLDEGHDVEAAPSADGPWSKVGKNAAVRGKATAVPQEEESPDQDD